MREILGYVPVEPDGSVKVAVPANVSFAISVLDGQGGRRLGPRHENWLSVRPGETRECSGCMIRIAPLLMAAPMPAPPRPPGWGGANHWPAFSEH